MKQFSRRDFFRKSVKKTLPIITILSLPSIGIFKSNAMSMSCNGCSTTCSGECTDTCKGTCYGRCQNSCYTYCTSSCTDSCKGSSAQCNF